VLLEKFLDFSLIAIYNIRIEIEKKKEVRRTLQICKILEALRVKNTFLGL